MSTIQVLAGDWGRHTSAVLLKSGGSRTLRFRPPLGASENIDLRVRLAPAEGLRHRKDYVRLGWSIDLVHRAPLRLTKPQGLSWFTARLRDGCSWWAPRTVGPMP